MPAAAAVEAGGRQFPTSLTELFDVARLSRSVLLQLLLQLRPVRPQEFFHSRLGIRVLPGTLQWLQGLQILLARIVKVWYRQFRQLVLRGERYTGAELRFARGERLLCGCGMSVHGGGGGRVSPGVWGLRSGQGFVERGWHGELAGCHDEGSLVKRKVMR